MSASIILAKELTTGTITHIDEVNKNDNKSFCCYDCDKEMVVVKSKARKKDWHFRHKEDSECTGKKDKALHDYAVHILFINYEIQLTKSLIINYSNARKEVWINDNYKSDVTVNYENQDIHFEVFVTHDLGDEKIETYRSDKIRCVRIDLSAKELLVVSSERIQNEVLKEIRNKTFIYWNDPEIVISIQSKEPKISSFPNDSLNEENNKLLYLLLLIISFLGIKYIFRKFFQRKEPRRKRK